MELGSPRFCTSWPTLMRLPSRTWPVGAPPCSACPVRGRHGALQLWRVYVLPLKEGATAVLPWMWIAIEELWFTTEIRMEYVAAVRGDSYGVVASPVKPNPWAAFTAADRGDDHSAAPQACHPKGWWSRSGSAWCQGRYTARARKDREICGAATEIYEEKNGEGRL
jgi:hypothetical protein